MSDQFSNDSSEISNIAAPDHAKAMNPKDVKVTRKNSLLKPAMRRNSQSQGARKRVQCPECGRGLSRNDAVVRHLKSMACPGSGDNKASKDGGYVFGGNQYAFPVFTDQSTSLHQSTSSQPKGNDAKFGSNSPSVIPKESTTVPQATGERGGSEHSNDLIVLERAAPAYVYDVIPTKWNAPNPPDWSRPETQWTIDPLSRVDHDGSHSRQALPEGPQAWALGSISNRQSSAMVNHGSIQLWDANFSNSDTILGEINRDEYISEWGMVGVEERLDARVLETGQDIFVMTRGFD